MARDKLEIEPSFRMIPGTNIPDKRVLEDAPRQLGPKENYDVDRGIERFGGPHPNLDPEMELPPNEVDASAFVLDAPVRRSILHRLGLTLLPVLWFWGSVGEARSEVTDYRLKVIPTGSQASPPIVIECSRGSVCRGQLRLAIHRRTELVWVVTTAREYHVYVRFLSEAAPLFVGDRPYARIGVGPAGRTEAKLRVSVPDETVLKEADDPLLWNSRPPAPVIAIVDVEIEPIGPPTSRSPSFQ